MLRALVALSLLSGLVAQQKPRSWSGWTALWNGKDLEGWHGQRHFSPYDLARLPKKEREAMRREDDLSMREHWRVEDGELVNDGQGAFLTSDRRFRNFDLRLEYLTVPRADSGIYLRGCPQVQIWDVTEEGGKWSLGADKGSGGLWNNQKHERFPPVCADKPFGEWNTLQIRMIGELVWVRLNGRVTVDGVVMENYWDRSRPMPAEGPIQLQTHGGEIRFRNVLIREMDPEDAAIALRARGGGGFETIFDGRSIDAFEGAVDDYAIDRGALRCKPGKGGTLFTKESYGDFIVQLEIRLPPGGNNGLAMRYPGEGTPAYTGVEIQVLDDGAEKHRALKPWQYHGSVYGVVAPHRGYLYPTGEWNYEEVRVQGLRYTVTLNGTVILDADIESLPSHLEHHTGKNRTEGRFGFCGHGDAVAFRNVRIKRL